MIDSQSLKPLKHLQTGRGHHEISFSKDSRFAFVSNRDDGTVSVVDIASLNIVQQIKTGSHPLSVAYSALSGAVYVADGKDGTVTVIDASTHAIRRVINLQQGLGPMGFSADGRFGVVLNTVENRATVIDAATNSAIHDLDVSAEPYQVVFTQAYAYIRGLASPKVTMINLSSSAKAASRSAKASKPARNHRVWPGICRWPQAWRCHATTTRCSWSTRSTTPPTFTPKA